MQAFSIFFIRSKFVNFQHLNYKSWVSKDASQPLEVVSAADDRFSSRVELSVRFGKTLLLTECDGVEPMLYPLVRKDLVHQGPRYVVQVGDKVSGLVDWLFIHSMGRI